MKRIEEIKKERLNLLLRKKELELEIEKINEQLKINTKELYDATKKHREDLMERRKSI